MEPSAAVDAAPARSPRQRTSAAAAAAAASWEPDRRASSSRGADAGDVPPPSDGHTVQLQIGMQVHVIWDDDDGGTSRWPASIIDVTSGGIQVLYSADGTTSKIKKDLLQHCIVTPLGTVLNPANPLRQPARKPPKSRISDDKETAAAQSIKLSRARRKKGEKYALKRVAQKDVIERPGRIVSAPGKFLCSTCGRRSQTAKLQAKHQRMHGPLAPMCIFCGERFLEAFIRDEHVRKHTGEKPYLCKQSPACTKRYHSIKVREDHMKRAHTAVKAYTCHYCNKRFNTSFESRRHEGRHEGRRPIPCGFQGCDAAFANDYDARSHMNTIHENPHIKPYKCPVCDRAFKDLQSQKRHLRTQHPEASPPALH